MPKVISSQITTVRKFLCLLIGVGEYQDKNLKTLSYAIADCQGLAQALEQTNHKLGQIKINALQQPSLSEVRHHLEQSKRIRR